jgi:WD40 repeat protein
MKGDFSRLTFDPKKHYSSVRMQQGRVQLDADWNEQIEIQAYLQQTEAMDMIGTNGTPKLGGGFKIEAKGPKHEILTISPGRIYVDGILCELDATPVPVGFPAGTKKQVELPGPVVDGRAFATGQWVEISAGDAPAEQFQIKKIQVKNSQKLTLDRAIDDSLRGSFSELRRLTSYDTQPDYPLPGSDQPEDGFYLAYLDVWGRHVTALEDPGIREAALGGADTATRVKTTWQVKLLPLGTMPGQGAPDIPAWTERTRPNRGRLTARRDSAAPLEDNRLYRVEIHQAGGGGEATFKWSRDNGAVVAEAAHLTSEAITLKTMGRGLLTRFGADQWVEVSDHARELRGEPGALVQLKDVQGDTLTLCKETPLNPDDFAPRIIVRQWGAEPKPITTGEFIELEDGIQVQFSEGQYRTGDYWLIPARTATNVIEWPQDSSGNAQPRPPHGVRHHYCRLAPVRWQNGGWEVIDGIDYRFVFTSLSGLKELNVLDAAINAPDGSIYVDEQGRVGIGTKKPRAKLHIEGRTADGTTASLRVTDALGSDSLNVGNDGRVGIGVTEPGAKLEVRTESYRFTPIGPVKKAIWSDDHGRLLMIYHDGKAQVWDIDRNKVITLDVDPTELGRIESAIWSPDKSWILAVKSDGKGFVWDFTRNHVIPLEVKMEEYPGQEWSPDGSRLLFIDSDKNWHVWDNEMSLLITLEIDAAESRAVSLTSWSSDSKQALFIHNDETMQVWDGGSSPTIDLNGKMNAVLNREWSPADNNYLVTVDSDCTVQGWGVSLDEYLTEFQYGDETVSHHGETGTVNTESVTCLTIWSPDGHRLLIIDPDGKARVWDATENQSIRLDVKVDLDVSGSAIWSPDGSLLFIVHTDGIMWVWDASRNRLITLQVDAAELGTIEQAILSPDGRRILIVNESGDMQVFDIEAHKLMPLSVDADYWDASSKGIWSPNGRRIVLIDSSSRAHLWDAEDQQIIPLDVTTGFSRPPEWSPNGRRFVFSDENSQVHVWDAEDNQLIPCQGSFGTDLWQLCWSPDGSRLLIVGSELKVWSVDTGALSGDLRDEGTNESVHRAIWSPDSQKVLIIYWNSRMQVWDDSSSGGRCLQGQLDRDDLVFWSDDGEALFVSDSGGAARVFTYSEEREAQLTHTAASFRGAAGVSALFESESCTSDVYLSFKNGSTAQFDKTWMVGMGNEYDPKFKIVFGADGEMIDTNAKLSISQDGKVGIGTTEPGASLEVRGGEDQQPVAKFNGHSNVFALLESEDSSEVSLRFKNGDTESTDQAWRVGMADDGQFKIAFGDDTEKRGSDADDDDDYDDDDDNEGINAALTITQDGNVGIGTPSLGEKLEVAGIVKATSFEGDGSKLKGIAEGLSIISGNVDAGAGTFSHPSFKVMSENKDNVRGLYTITFRQPFSDTPRGKAFTKSWDMIAEIKSIDEKGMTVMTRSKDHNYGTISDFMFIVIGPG